MCYDFDTFAIDERPPYQARVCSDTADSNVLRFIITCGSSIVRTPICFQLWRLIGTLQTCLAAALNSTRCRFWLVPLLVTGVSRHPARLLASGQSCPSLKAVAPRLFNLSASSGSCARQQLLRSNRDTSAQDALRMVTENVSDELD
jgi:hypothetical protein